MGFLADVLAEKRRRERIRAVKAEIAQRREAKCPYCGSEWSRDDCGEANGWWRREYEHINALRDELRRLEGGA